MGGRLSRAVEGSVLVEAAANNEAGVVEQVLQACPRALLYKTLFRRRTPLMLAAEGGGVESLLKLMWAAERLLGGAAFQAYLDDADARGNTALLLAAKRGHTACVRLLLEDSASPLPANARGDTALHQAASHGQAACVDLLLRAWVRSRSGATVRAAEALVLDGFGEDTRYVDAHNAAGLAALHLAALAGSAESAAVLIRSGASPDVPVLRGLQPRLPYLSGGSTALHIAAYQGDARMCLVLLEAQWRQPGVELRRLRNARGLTPLNCALLEGHHDLARVLVETRAPGSVLALSRRALDYQFPEPLRQHLLAILHRARLLVELREISRRWRDQGMAKPSDDSVKMVGLAELRPSSIERLVALVQREGASLRDILSGLEEAFSPPAPPVAAAGGGGGAPSSSTQPVPLPAAARAPATVPAEGPSAAVGGAAGSSVAATTSGSSPAPSASTASAAAGPGSSSREEGGVEGRRRGELEDSSDSEAGGRGNRRRRGGHSRASRRRGRYADREPPATGHGGPSSSRDVDWTILEAQRMLSLDPWGMSLSGRRRGRSRRSGRRAGSVERDVLPQTVLEVQRSASSVMPPHRRRQRSREARQQVLAELIESVHSAEEALGLGTGLEAHDEAGSSSAAAGPSRQQPLQPQPSTSRGGPGSSSCSTSSSGGANEERNQLAASVSAASSQGAAECFICMDAEADVAVAGCGHAICFICACKVVARSQGPSCPFCRGPIASFQLLPGARQGQHQHQEPERMELHSQQEKLEQQCQTAHA